MNEFKCTITYGPDGIVWTFSGVMNEHMVLPEIEKTRPLVINLKKVEMINSYGIKIWCHWMDTNKDYKKLTLEECPFVFTKNFAQVSNFVNESTVINSFFVPFFSEETQERKDILLNLGEDYQINGFLRLPDVKDTKGEYMELDVDPTRFFAFLRRR